MKLTHSLQANKSYLILAEKKVLGRAVKVAAGGFNFVGDANLEVAHILSARTMKELKEKILSSMSSRLIEKIEAAARHRGEYSVEDARRLCAISHNGIAVLIKEFAERRLPSFSYGDRIVARHMQECARFGHQFAIRFLDRHPKFVNMG